MRSLHAKHILDFASAAHSMAASSLYLPNSLLPSPLLVAVSLHCLEIFVEVGARFHDLAKVRPIQRLPAVLSELSRSEKRVADLPSVHLAGRQLVEVTLELGHVGILVVFLREHVEKVLPYLLAGVALQVVVVDGHLDA
jgi:hypothetical protein